MSDLLQRVFNNLNRKGDGDMVDRLSATITVTLLIVGSMIVSAKQYVGMPIQCFVSAELTKPMEKYVENYCFAQSTYFVPFDKPIPLRMKRPKPERLVSYYQWVPFILCLQAVLFYAPRLFWRIMSSISGINLNALHTMACQSMLCDIDKRDEAMIQLSEYVRWALNLHRAARRRSSYDCLGRLANVYLVVVFLLTKSLYVANAVGQIFLLDALLQTRDPFFGVNLLRDLINGTEWRTSGFFPRVTMCDVEIHDVGNIRPYTFQCVLMINVFNEKLFILLWFWTMFVFVASSSSFVYWLVSTILPGARRRFVRRLLPELPPDKQHPLAGNLSSFANDYLDVDGVFLLRSINDRVGSIVTSKVATYLWRDYVRDVASKKKDEIDSRRNAKSIVDRKMPVAPNVGKVSNRESPPASRGSQIWDGVLLRRRLDSECRSPNAATFSQDSRV